MQENTSITRVKNLVDYIEDTSTKARDMVPMVKLGPIWGTSPSQVLFSTTGAPAPLIVKVSPPFNCPSGPAKVRLAPSPRLLMSAKDHAIALSAPVAGAFHRTVATTRAPAARAGSGIESSAPWRSTRLRGVILQGGEPPWSRRWSEVRGSVLVRCSCNPPF